MSTDGDDFAARAQKRHSWPVVRSVLGRESDDDLTATTTVEQRLDMMWQLALDAWASSGRSLPSYGRADMPGNVLRSSRDRSAGT